MMVKPTVKQILAIEKRINDARSRVDELINKRNKMVEASDLRRPRGFNDPPSETFVKVEGKACRILVDRWGSVVCEELPF
jgi:ribosome biogenesis GTPase A